MFVINHNFKSCTSSALSDSLQSYIEKLVGFKDFYNIVKFIKNAYNYMHYRFYEYVVLLNNSKYVVEEVLAHDASHILLSMCFLLDLLSFSLQFRYNNGIFRLSNHKQLRP